MELHIRTNGNLIIEITGYVGNDILEYPLFNIFTLQDISCNETLLYCLERTLTDFKTRLAISKLKVSRYNALKSLIPQGIDLRNWDLSEIGALKCNENEFNSLLFYLVNIYGAKKFTIISEKFVSVCKEINESLNTLANNN
jgi:hypothetical protein